MISPQDTIAAIATPAGRGGIGIVRISGAMARDIACAVVGAMPAPRLATRARFHGAGGELLDEGLVLFFPAPHSYTGEAVLELQGHGSPMALRLILARCLELGARLAQPGEFTQRAFLNGKLDLAQAEAVADLIDAATTSAARAAARSLTGVFSRELHLLLAKLIELRMFTESALDFPDEDLEFIETAGIDKQLAALRGELDSLLRSAQQGARLREGLAVVLIGQPNVGKSSLLNRLAGEDLAIVTEIPGTTRDAVASPLEIGGIPLRVIDTAGLRTTDDAIEALGIERTWSAIRQADLALVVVDARATDGGLTLSDRAIVDQLPAGLPRILVHNKTDLLAGGAAGAPRHAAVPEGDKELQLWLSAKTGAGVEYLRAAILTAVGAQDHTEAIFLARERHLRALQDAGSHLRQAAERLAAVPPPLELFAEELRGAQNAFNAVTGEFGADDLLGIIFSRFCIGK